MELDLDTLAVWCMLTTLSTWLPCYSFYTISVSLYKSHVGYYSSILESKIFSYSVSCCCSLLIGSIIYKFHLIGTLIGLNFFNGIILVLWCLGNSLLALDDQ